MTTDPVQLLIDAGAIPTTPFAPNSRYDGVALGRYAARAPAIPASPTCCAASSRSRATSRSPPSTSCAAASGPTCSRAQYLGDPLLYWRIADANAVDRPDRAHRHARARASRSRCRRACRRGSMHARRHQALAAASARCRCRRRARSWRRWSRAKVEAGSGETQSGFELTFELPRARRCARCSCSPAAAACR